MTDADVLRKLILTNPEKKFYVKLLADELAYQIGLPRFTALRQGAALRRGVLNAREIADAAALLDDHSVTRENLYSAIVAWSNNPRIRIAKLTVVAGSRPPFAKSRYTSNAGAWWYEWDVTVGARWVIREALDIQLDLNYLAGAITSNHAGS